MSKVVRPIIKIGGVALGLAGSLIGGPLGALAMGAGIGLSFLGRERGRREQPQFQVPQVPQTPPPLSTTVKASTASRVLAYGRVRQSGVVFLEETTTNKRYLFYGIYLNDGPVDGFDALICDDELVPLQQSYVISGWVPDPILSPNIFQPSSGSKSPNPPSNFLTSSIIAVEAANASRSGYPSFLMGPHAQTLDAAWARVWTDAHLGKGVTSYYLRADATAAAGDRFKIFPNGFPKYSFIYRGARVYDPRDPTQVYSGFDLYDSTWKWRENPALCAAHYVNWLISENLTAIKGINWLSVAEAADDCDRLVPIIRAGFNSGAPSYEPFARMSALVTLDMEPRDVLRKIMECCDADYGVDQNGLFTMAVGKWREPSITFTGTDISTFIEDFGPSSNDEVNSIRATYIEPRQNHQRMQAPIYEDAYSISKIGQRAGSFDLEWVTSVNQAWRLAARKVKRANRKRRITCSLGARAMTALKQRVVALSAPEFGLTGTFEIESLAPDGSLSNWQASLIEVTPDIFEDEAAPVDTVVNFAIINQPALSAPTSLIPAAVLTGSGVGVAQLSLDANKNTPDQAVPNITATALLADPLLQLDGRWSINGGATWSNFDVLLSQLIMQTPELPSGAQVTMQARWVSSIGSTSAYSTSVAVTIP